MTRPIRWFDYITFSVYFLGLTTLSQTMGLVIPLLVQQFVGEAQKGTYFGTYRLWFSTATVNAWKSRPVLSNEDLDGTFVYGNERVVYNMGARLTGSPWHQTLYNSPTGPACT